MEEQARICGLKGSAAKKAGAQYSSWKDDQVLYWKGVRYERCGQEYQDLLDRLYQSVRLSCAEFREALRQSGNKRLAHTIGSHDPHMTVLTVTELISRLYESRDQLRNT